MKRFRAIAAKERQIAAEYARKAATVADQLLEWNAKEKANAEARAAAADQAAGRLQTVVDFHVAAAAKEAGR